MMDPKALFIGPYGENSKEFREAMQLVLEDIVQWRRNFHPSDERLILPVDKENSAWKETSASSIKELDKLLGDLKSSIPFHNPRFIGHMHADLAMPALLGYFAGQLYNQNNVVGESSPVTTRKEMEFIHELCTMVGYPESEYSLGKTDKNDKEFNTILSTSTGHLTSGGTTANIEAAWTARNIKYYPLSVKLFAEDKLSLSLLENRKSTEVKYGEVWEKIIGSILRTGVELEGSSFEIKDITFQQLFNLPAKSAFKLRFDLQESMDKELSTYFNAEPYNTKAEKIKECKSIYSDVFQSYTVRSKGMHGIHSEITRRNNDKEAIKNPVVLIPQSRHYSWEKAIDIIGLGANQIKYLRVDNKFKIDLKHYKELIEGPDPILMAVGVLGSTEEGAIDPICEMINANKDAKNNFWFHIDAAYGGYYTAMIRKTDSHISYNVYDENVLEKNRENLEKVIPTNKSAVWDQYVKDNKVNEIIDAYATDLTSVAQADSVTIDPHKLGYIPYSVGAVLYKSKFAKDFIFKGAPYLSDNAEDNSDTTKAYLGGSILEGSRSGAAALACYLTSKIIPADQSGYGRLMVETIANAHDFYNILKSKVDEKENKPSENKIEVKIHFLYKPETNILCYVAMVPEYIKTPEHLNILTQTLYEQMRIDSRRQANEFDYYVSRTEFKYQKSGEDPKYQKQIDGFLEELNINEKLDNPDTFELFVLRSVLMNPIVDAKQRWNIFSRYKKHLTTQVIKILPKVLSKILEKENNGKRVDVLWIENKKNLLTLKQKIDNADLKTGIDISRYANIDFVKSYNKNQHSLRGSYDGYIVDLNLIDNTLHKEWISGIKAFRDIITDVNKKNPVTEFTNEDAQNAKIPDIFFYSQFFSEHYKYNDIPSGGEKLKGVLRNFLNHYAGTNIPKEHFMAKTMSDESDLKELNDMELLVSTITKNTIKRLYKIKNAKGKKGEGR